MISLSQPFTTHQTPPVRRNLQQHRVSKNQVNCQQNQYQAYTTDSPSDVTTGFPAVNHLTPSHIDEILNTFVDSLPAESMQSDSWDNSTPFTSKPNRFTHNRESSLSSLGSAGPASPYAHSKSNPQIAVTDSTNDGMSDMHTEDSVVMHNNSYYQLAKTIGSYPGYQNIEGTMPEMAYPVAISGPTSKLRLDRALLPAPEFAGGPNRSYPASVASSVAGDSPATPTIGESEHPDRRRQGYNNVPKLNRTMTDVYGDELYSPDFTITPTSPRHSQLALSSNNDIFNQRINTANSQHLNATSNSPASTTSRARSPFRTESPFASGHGQGLGPGNAQFHSVQSIREQGRDLRETQFMQAQVNAAVESETPKTISPKDAMLEFHEAEGEANFSLFPQSSADLEMDQLAVHCTQTAESGSGGTDSVSQMHFLPSQIPVGIQVPQQYPFVARAQGHDSSVRLSPASSSSIGSGSDLSGNLTRPKGCNADGGTYTCTYHGCMLRFETPMLLQKHKREGHRQTQALGASRVQEIGALPGILNTQTGPHRCDRINPSTGKPCSTVFSRPYDLTRHEDTIHNGRKQKVRCNLCTEEKTFSRADALTRHYRVCHPDVDLPGKRHRRTDS